MTRVFPVTFTLSVLINSAFLFSVNRFVENEQVRTTRLIEKQKSREAKDLQFQFVETPAVTAEKPENASKISSRHAQNQDSTLDKTGAQTLPKTERIGTADQLRQVRGLGAPAPQPAGGPPKEEKKEQPPQPVEQKAGTENDEIPRPAPPKETAQAQEQAVPPQPPAPKQESGAKDRISTQEMARAASVGAKLYGITSFEATGSGMGEYMKNLKEKIWLSWFPNLAFKYPQDFKTADAVLSFKLNKEGEIKIISVVESRGSPLFAVFCMEAVQRAGTFGKLPEEILALLGKEELEIRFAFHYR